ncbi:hypothetical protein WJX74_000573 [Apatococcus lobatus]|uniref:AAA+ ATPase domain-containing protein n=1 Tax=Apatococcus lobatus TaxID=904363 RepID=A0AAW1RVY8_9CHLO
MKRWLDCGVTGLERQSFPTSAGGKLQEAAKFRIHARRKRDQADALRSRTKGARIPNTGAASGSGRLHNPQRPPQMAGDTVPNLGELACDYVQDNADPQLYWLQNSTQILSDPTDGIRQVNQYLDKCVFPKLGDGTKRKQGLAFQPELGEGPPAMFVNGLVKTGKSYWTRVVIPSCLGKHPKLLGRTAPLMLYVDCSTLPYQDGAEALLRGLLEKVLRWAAAQRPYIAPAVWAQAVKAAAVPAGLQVPQQDNLFCVLKELLDNIAHPMLILVDEAQFLMMPGKPGGGVNADEADWMRDVVVRQLIIYNASTQIFVFTGSTMALMWLALARMPKNGRSPLMAIKPLHLPSEFPASHMQAVGAAIGVTEEQLMIHSPGTPACLTILQQDWKLHGEESPSVRAFVQSWTVDKLQRESIADWTRALDLWMPGQRIAARRLSNPQEGLDVLEHLGPGLVQYLKPYCKKNKAGRFYLRAVQARTVMQVIIAEDGSLNKSWMGVAGDSSSSEDLIIISDLHAIGETVGRMAKDELLPQAGVDDFELWLEGLASDMDARLPCGQWKDETWHQQLSTSPDTSADAKAYKKAKAAAPEGAPLTAKEELKWVLRFIRHIIAHAGILTDPGIGQDLGNAKGIKALQIRVEAIFPDLLQCTRTAFVQRLGEIKRHPSATVEEQAAWASQGKSHDGSQHPSSEGPHRPLPAPLVMLPCSPPSCQDHRCNRVKPPAHKLQQPGRVPSEQSGLHRVISTLSSAWPHVLTTSLAAAQSDTLLTGLRMRDPCAIGALTTIHEAPLNSYPLPLAPVTARLAQVFSAARRVEAPPASQAGPAAPSSLLLQSGIVPCLAPCSQRPRRALCTTSARRRCSGSSRLTCGNPTLDD